METEANLTRCFSYLSAQLRETKPGWEVEPKPLRMSVTISRMAGARGHTIANRLARLLQRTNDDAMHPWLLFDQSLIQEVIKEHHLPLSAAAYMREENPIGEIEGLVGEILGLHPSTAELAEKTHRTIRRLARMGHTIILGRGSNFLTLDLPHVMQVRLVGSLDKRIDHIATRFNLARLEAAVRIKRADKARAAYVSKHFSHGIDDLMSYDLVLNTDRLSNDAAADIIARVVLDQRKELLRRREEAGKVILRGSPQKDIPQQAAIAR